MQAIITNKEINVFGRTFGIKNISNKNIELLNNCIFEFSDVLIVDIDFEIQKAYNQYNRRGDSLYYRLRNYCISNKIEFVEPIIIL
jgi:hypothetical protein